VDDSFSHFRSLLHKWMAGGKSTSSRRSSTAKKPATPKSKRNSKKDTPLDSSASVQTPTSAASSPPSSRKSLRKTSQSGNVEPETNNNKPQLVSPPTPSRASKRISNRTPTAAAAVDASDSAKSNNTRTPRSNSKKPAVQTSAGSSPARKQARVESENFVGADAAAVVALAPVPSGSSESPLRKRGKFEMSAGAATMAMDTSSIVAQPKIDDLTNRVNKLSMETPTSRQVGVQRYYDLKTQKLALDVNEKGNNVRRLQAQRNELNTKVRATREELQLLHEQASYVGEVVKPLDKKKVLVKINPEGKFIVDIDKDIKIEECTTGTRVALRSDSYTLHKILPNKIDPLVSLMMVEKVPDSTYDTVGGLSKQIKEIKEVIELPVKHPELFEALGISQPKGVLLYGPPGTGKTLLARAVAHHTDCTFIRVSGSELVQKFIGEGSRMVRELFVMARQHSPSIIFMDEIDSIGSTRLESGGGGDSEVQRTMLELLNQLDGFEPHQNIKIIMATNRIDILDSALLRPGRIDRKIEFPAPNEDARLDILSIHSRKMNLTRGINLRKIAELMPGASGAEVKGVCTEAGMFALRERRVHVTQEDFEMAVAKIMQRDQDKNISIKKLMK